MTLSSVKCTNKNYMKNVEKIKKKDLKLILKIIGIIVAFMAAIMSLGDRMLDYYIDEEAEVLVE